MSDTVNTVGDLSGKHVGTDMVRIVHAVSVIEGIIRDHTITAEYEPLADGTRLYLPATVNISIGNEFEHNNFPIHAPASIETRSDPQVPLAPVRPF